MPDFHSEDASSILVEATIKICPSCGRQLRNKRSVYCSSKCSRACQERKPHTEESKKKISDSLLGRLSPKKGTGWVPQEKVCPICDKFFMPPKPRSIYCCLSCSSIGKSRELKKTGVTKAGGYREGSGRSKSGWYKGIFCGSTYELIFVVWFLEKGIPINRCQSVLEYEFNGKTHKYHPDFEINGLLYEVKGYWTKQSEAKRNQHPEVIIVDKYDILFMKDGCSLKGKSLSGLVELYEPRPQ